MDFHVQMLMNVLIRPPMAATTMRTVPTHREVTRALVQLIIVLKETGRLVNPFSNVRIIMDVVIPVVKSTRWILAHVPVEWS